MANGSFTFDHDEVGGKFSYYLEGRLAGLMTFKWDGKTTMVFDHTEVLEGFNGMGIGKIVVEYAAHYAGDNGFKINPTCPYAAKVIQASEVLSQYLAQ